VIDISNFDDIKTDRYFLFKHSSTCPISAGAQNAVRSAEKQIEIPIYRVVVQAHRDLSNRITEQFGIVHESPQIILVDGGAARWSTSHYGITAAAIEKASRLE
jgi:bacillithiol system protein YtxJ